MKDLDKIANKITKEMYIVNKLAFDMTKKEWEDYKKEHPNADKRNHNIVEKQKPNNNTQFKGQYKNKRVINKKQLVDTLDNGHYSIISAGRNPNDPKESGLDEYDESFSKRYEELQSDLDKLGLPFIEVMGYYEGEERSFMVLHDEPTKDSAGDKHQSNGAMVHYKDNEQFQKMKTQMNELGKKYNQDSVLHSSQGKNTMSFTTGEKEGQECGGDGWKSMEAEKDYFSEAKTEDGYTKWQNDLTDCFERGML